jgi:hypothetical protein
MSVPGVALVAEQHQATRVGRSLRSRYVDKLHLPGGGVSLGGKEAGRDGGSDTIRRRRPSASAPPKNPVRRVLINFRAPAAPTDPTTVTCPPPHRHPLLRQPDNKESGRGGPRSAKDARWTRD